MLNEAGSSKEEEPNQVYVTDQVSLYIFGGVRLSTLGSLKGRHNRLRKHHGRNVGEERKTGQVKRMRRKVLMYRHSKDVGLEVESHTDGPLGLLYYVSFYETFDVARHVNI